MHRMIHPPRTQRSHFFIRSFLVANRFSHHSRLFSVKTSVNSFACPLCTNERKFLTFAQYFRHITLFHQNEPKFRIVYDLAQTCGTMYRTFSAYKSHVYRCHQDELNAIRHQPANIHLQADDEQHRQAAEEIYFTSLQSDSDEETNGASGDHDRADFQEEMDAEWH